VPDVVQPDVTNPCQVHEAVESPRHGVRMHAATVLENISLRWLGLAPAERLALAVKHLEVSPQRRDGELVERNRQLTARSLARMRCVGPDPG
jgi:hypothetical protein